MASLKAVPVLRASPRRGRLDSSIAIEAIAFDETIA